jgi:alkanesulfonate monooxygenase SsuD/methylene tetrahydromethanopterin reductase-like flavin-dependent oxidoreductase (luciferase family)
VPDYGRDLLFGSFVTPSAQQPHQVVGLAQASEEAGLDLVTFQDHPYQPGFLDTWTLLTYVAASTTTIQLAPNVLNVPLRPPSVTARAAASLDLLSAGRLNLGLGAGGFWDAIEAMGGTRLSGGEAVRALEEAIRIIRELWDTDQRGGVRIAGERYRVHGAKRGPAPAHAIPIWVGAYKPRMLRLTGSLGDGWLPSAGYLQPGDLARGNEIIDTAARDAGRQPAAVRRLLNVFGSVTATGSSSSLFDGPFRAPVERWVDELATLAVEEGISVFIMGSDDPLELQLFGQEVAPAVRDAVDHARSHPVSASSAEPGAQAALSASAGLATTSTGATTSGSASTSASASSSDSGTRAPASGFTLTPTPDDGTRLSDELPWDESDRPTGPAPDPSRRYTAHDLAAGQHLIDIHDALRSELEQVRDLMEQVLRGATTPGAARSELNRMTMRQNNWTLGTYCQSYCRIVTGHHGLEDRSVFPHLRRGDERLVPVIDRLEAEHRVIHDVLDGVDRALVDFVSADGGDGAPLRRAVDLLTDTLLSHLAYEERELVEPIARLGLS